VRFRQRAVSMTSVRRKGLTGAQASVVINNYNYGRFLRDAIESALAQTYQPLEVIVVDDGSTDESRDIIASYGDRIIPVLKPNAGQASTFNIGFEKSKGEVILFLDADDVLLPKAIERAMKSFRPGVVKVHWQLRETREDLRKTPRRVPPEPLLVGDAREITFSEGAAVGLSPPTSGNAWARSFLERVMPIPEEDFRLGADGYLYGLAPAFGIIARLSQPLSLYRIHGDNSYRHTALEDRVRIGLLWSSHRWRALAAYAREIGVKVDEMNWEKHSYFHQLRDATRDLESVVPPGARLILMDETRWASGPTISGRPVIPFIERRGIYWGRPEYDADAIEELERLRSKRGAEYLVVGWPAFWWLEHYRGFAEYLRSRYTTLLANELVIVFDLRGDSASRDSAPAKRHRKRTRSKARPQPENPSQ
jgi:hypothetical protein